MARRKRFTSSKPMAPTGRGKERCGVIVVRTEDGHVMRCQAKPHGDELRHNPGPWTYDEGVAA